MKLQVIKTNSYLQAISIKIYLGIAEKEEKSFTKLF